MRGSIHGEPAGDAGADNPMERTVEQLMILLSEAQEGLDLAIYDNDAERAIYYARMLNRVEAMLDGDQD